MRQRPARSVTCHVRSGTLVQTYVSECPMFGEDSASGKAEKRVQQEGRHSVAQRRAAVRACRVGQ